MDNASLVSALSDPITSHHATPVHVSINMLAYKVEKVLFFKHHMHKYNNVRLYFDVV